MAAEEKHPSPLVLQEAARLYKQGSQTLHVFENLNLSLQAGETVALVGPSGAGKSSLLHMAGLLEAPSAGEVFVMGRGRKGMKEKEASFLRRSQIGFVFQFHYLMAKFTALENVALGGMIAGLSKKKAQSRAKTLLSEIGLGNRLSHRPSALSGGEQQRVAVARALINAPSLVLADEPTGNLDLATAQDVFKDLLDHARQHHAAILVATHNMSLAEKADRILRLSGGSLEEIGRNGG